MSGVKNIQGAAKGTYRDGGIIDYHFDFSLQKSSVVTKNNPNECGLTLYPHFSSEPKAGWFDKNSTRKVLASSYDNTVLLSPSKKFIKSLPFSKIPDRTDFTKLDANTRINYWQQVLTQTDILAECFHEFVTKQGISQIKAFTP
ncbi:hypothetical protein BPTFM16_02829 [Altererythrobacter insulae]|nr:hypothetical protein BPTFM16_02829 [Altererythrobacter insulae]